MSRRRLDQLGHTGFVRSQGTRRCIRIAESGFLNDVAAGNEGRVGWKDRLQKNVKDNGLCIALFFRSLCVVQVTCRHGNNLTTTLPTGRLDGPELETKQCSAEEAAQGALRRCTTDAI